MIANVHLEAHALDVGIRPFSEHAGDFYDALGEQASSLSIALALRQLPHADAVAAVGRAFAKVYIDSASTDRDAPAWGEWFAAHPDEFYQLFAVCEHPEHWGEWADGGS